MGITDPQVTFKRATTIITLTGIGVADETVNIGDKTYTMKASPAAAYEVHIGTNATTHAANLAAAINVDGTGATDGNYGALHVEVNPYVSATSSAGVVTLTARNAGVEHNGLKLLWSLTNGTNVDAALSASASAVAGTGSNVTFKEHVKTHGNAHLRGEAIKAILGD